MLKTRQKAWEMMREKGMILIFNSLALNPL